MRISGLNLVGFMGHDDYTIRVPASGILLITGGNGRGKSAFIEAIAEAIWGESLRGRRWTQDYTLQVLFPSALDQFVRRTSTKGKFKVWAEWLGRFDTPSKAQAAIDAALGTFDQWRRSHVFSSSDAANFSSASDAERKELIEGLLGLSRFEQGAGACSADLSTASAVVQRDQVNESRLRGVVQALGQRAEQIRSQPTSTEPAGELPDIHAARARAVAAQTGVERNPRPDNQKAIGDTMRAMLQARQSEQLATRELVELRRKRESVVESKCHACGQSISDRDAQLAKLAEHEVILEQSLARATEEQAAQKDAHDLAQEAQRERQQAHDFAQIELMQAIQDLRETQEIHAEHRDRQARHNQHTRALQAAETELAQARLNLDQAGDDLAKVQEDQRVLELCRDVLGPRGARVTVLSEALSGVESVANYWLSRLFSSAVHCTIQLGEESRERGQRAGSIALTIHGVGDGGYKSLSGGQRRRVDVALQLALAEVASLASGREPGTLWVDEAFDALDAEGVEAVQAALADIASDRCVVVISHSETVISGLRPVGRIQL